jgi:hypothetical protein
MQTEEAKRSAADYVARKLAAKEPLDAHDPEFLYCLDKVDIISRYGMLVDQHERYKQTTAEFHEGEIRRLKATIEKAGRWWDHCLKLRREKRKTAHLADMFPEEREVAA